MQEQGNPLSDSSASILVAAGPMDERAIELVQAMRQAGQRVTFANNVNIAARASEAAACVVLLRPDTWKTPAIATVMRAKPDCLIPVLAEPMDLPRGPWTHESISLGSETEQTAQEVVQVLRTYLDTHPTPVLTLTPVPTLRRDTGPLTLAPATKFKKRRRLNAGSILTTLLIFLIVGLGAALGYRYNLAHPAKGQATSSNASAPTTIALPTYSTKKLGDLCDSGNGQWEQADRYKKDKKTEVYDRYISTQCQSDGLLIMRSGAYDVYSTVFFDGIGISPFIAQHTFVQVDATIVSGDAQADISISTHVQNNSYGSYGFDVNTLGHWEANVGSTVDGSPINRLAIGFFPKASKTYTLALETDGPVMTFWINGVKVTSVADTTYAANDAIGFGVSDYSSTQPISALFSNFQYKELPPSTLATPHVIATATAQTQASLQSPYTAHVPGYGCDQGAGQWQPLADDNSTGTLNCQPNGMQLTNPANATQITNERFYWLNGHFPQNYQVSVQINVSAAKDGCAGLATRIDDNGRGYFFVICSDGSWEVTVFTDKFHLLDRGTVSPHSSYLLKVIDQGATQSLSINGSQVSAVNDAQLKSTDHLSLLVGYYQVSQPSTATFSDFAFTPLP